MRTAAADDARLVQSGRAALRSLSRLMCAAISRMTSTPRPFGRAHDRVEVVRFPVVDHDVSAVLAHRLRDPRRFRRSDHRHAVRVRDLHGGDADAAARAVHEDGFAGPRLGALEERAERGAVRHAERRALRERHARGQPMELRRRADGACSAYMPRLDRRRTLSSAMIHAIAGLESFFTSAPTASTSPAPSDARRVGQRRLARRRHRCGCRCRPD